MSGMPLVIRRKARIDFDHAFDWYEEQRSGLGAEFAEHLQVVFERISSMPELHGIVHGDVCKVLVRPFPYSVFYRI